MNPPVLNQMRQRSDSIESSIEIASWRVLIYAETVQPRFESTSTFTQASADGHSICNVFPRTHILDGASNTVAMPPATTPGRQVRPQLAGHQSIEGVGPKSAPNKGQISAMRRFDPRSRLHTFRNLPFPPAILRCGRNCSRRWEILSLGLCQ